MVRLSDLAPLASGFWRLGLSLPVLALMLWFTRSRAQKDEAFTRRDHWLLLIAGVAYGVDIACWHLALFYTSVADATLIVNLAPIIVTLSAIALYGEKPGPVYLTGFSLAISGALWLILQKAAGPEPVNRFLGDGMAIGAAVSYAAYMVIASGVRRRHSAQIVVFYTTLISGLMMLAMALFMGQSLWPQSLFGWAVILGIALISHTGGQSLIIYALGHLPASFASLTQFLQTAVAAMGAWLLLAEPMTAMKLAAALAILAGIVICRADPPRRQETR